MLKDVIFHKIMLDFYKKKTAIAKIKQPNPENFQNPTVFYHIYQRETIIIPKVMAFSLFYIFIILLNNSSIP